MTRNANKPQTAYPEIQKVFRFLIWDEDIMFIFTNYAEKKLKKIVAHKRKNIILKMKRISAWKIDGDFRKMYNFSPATHRLRIGEYRVILKREDNEYIVLDIWHRSSIYK